MEVKHRCHFCNGGSGDTSVLISGQKANICDSCVRACLAILEKEGLAQEDIAANIRVLSPSAIKSFLDKHVVGQNNAKRKLAIAGYMHHQRINDMGSLAKESGTFLYQTALLQGSLPKSNVLLIGPTGVGKTLLVHTLAKTLGVPFVSVDATSFTEAGYSGADVEDIIRRLYYNAGSDITLASRGIVHIDEFDKLRSMGAGSSSYTGASREGVQQSLLKMIEGYDVAFEDPNQRGNEVIVNTSNVLFIFSGAFVGLEEYGRTQQQKRTIGFTSPVTESSSAVVPQSPAAVEDLIDYGIIPELVGRISIIERLEPLTLDMMKDILTQPEGSIIKQYQSVLSLDNISVDFSEAALTTIAELAFKLNLGARGLRTIVESILSDILFHAPENKGSVYLIDEKAVLDSVGHVRSVATQVS